MIPISIALRITSTVVSASNFARMHLRYHLMVARLRQSDSAIWGLVFPSAIMRKMVISFEDSFGILVFITSCSIISCKFR